jgi:glycosyltransferase involved in cell wall biosynthesis
VKVDGINKYDSLKNLQKTFKDWEWICVADNCDDQLLNNLKSQFSFDQLIETQLGNPGSFWKLYEIALSFIKDEDVVYFVEDDYLHLPEAPAAIIDGLQYFDYVTLYDHPDKYKNHNGPLNPYVKLNAYSESTEVVKSPNYIWRTTNSTTMTFAVKGKILKADQDIWLITKSAKKDFDFDNFCLLTKQATIAKTRFIKQLPRKIRFWNKARRYMGACIPGLALHLETAYISQLEEERFLIQLKLK